MLEVAREKIFKEIIASICTFLGYVGMVMNQMLHLRTQPGLIRFDCEPRNA